MKLPNGFGSVVRLSGNRRNPFWVRKTVGWNDKGHPIYETVGYAKTREDGIIMLSDFNNDPWDIDANKLTFKELYEMWVEKKLPKLGDGNQAAMKTAFGHCKKLHHLVFKKITVMQLRDVIDNCNKSYAAKNAIKAFYDKMYKFAIEMQIKIPNYAELIESAPITPNERIIFSDFDIEKLWRNSSNERIQNILLLLYTGFRISELFDVRIEDINLEEGTIKGGLKTAAGKNRIVPIHSLILPIVTERCKNNSTYLVENESHNKMLTKNFHRYFWKQTLELANITEKYTPHCCRHTLRTKMDNVGANKRCMDLIMGHYSRDVGERVYNHKTIIQLKENIELVTR